MSIKTLRKRIALVAVSALGAGLISVVAVPTASAALLDNAIANTNIIGNSANGGAAALTDPIGSNGLIATNGASSPNALLQTATIYATGTIAVATAAATTTSNGTTTTEAQRISVSGGTISGAAAAIAGGTNGTVSIAADKSRADIAASSTNTHRNRLAALVTPNSGVTTMTISGWNSYVAGNDPAWIVTVSVAAASAVGVATVADSSVAFTAADGNAATADVAGANAATSRTPLYLNVQLNDVYGNDVTAGGVVVEVSSGAIVGLSANTGAVGALSTSTHSAIALTSSVSPADINIRVQEATAGKGWNGTIKVTWNGLVIATKTGSILGDIAKITVTPTKIGKNDGNASATAFDYQATDAAGNVVVLANANLVLSSSSNAGIVSGAVGTADNSAAAAGKGSITCASGATGKSSVVMQTTLTATGAVIKSNAAEFSCAGDAVAYTASLDKASYAQGEIATLTIQFLSATGAPANSVTAVTANTNDAVVSATQMERVTAYTNAQKTDVNGQVKFTFTVGTSSGVVAGKYNAVASFPTINAIAGKNQAVAYEVTAPASVSNAEVLASIVKLIAAINKQIRALQKSLRR